MRTERYSEVITLGSEIEELLTKLRTERAFRGNECIEGKAALMNRYFQEHGLSGAIVGISGGIDSAVTLALLHYASKQPGSPIEQIVPVSLPFTIEYGVSGQDKAREKAQLLCEHFGLTAKVVDLGETHERNRECVAEALGVKASAWADGQLAAYLRTPSLYYVAAILTDEGYPALVCGTTNRDEGAYLGFFGKASDGMVDLQVISDLHKSEVYSLAELLGVPDGIRKSAPTGDVYDGKTHLEMIGVPYDAVELYLTWLRLNEDDRARYGKSLSSSALDVFAEIGERVERMHRYNAHKYLSGTPSIHLDIYPRCVPGGWREESPNKAVSRGERKLIGEFVLDQERERVIVNGNVPDVQSRVLHPLHDDARYLEHLLTREECDLLVSSLNQHALVPAGQNGVARDFVPGRDQLGSLRATVYNEQIAAALWRRIRGHIPTVRAFDEYAATDAEAGTVWRATGVNPSFRFIKYLSDGNLIPHYDAAYDFGDGKRRTLMSLVIYLTDVEDGAGGATRFLTDLQRNIPYHERDFSDWKRKADQSMVVFAVSPIAGDAIVFDHRVLHDAEPWVGRSSRIIIRTDIVFERCGPVVPAPRSDSLSEGAELLSDRVPAAVLRDPFYRSTLETFGTMQDVMEAGYFDDGHPVESDSPSEREDKHPRDGILCTPLDKVVQRLLTQGKGDRRLPLVLLATGGYCPIHAGHVAMMEEAKRVAEKAGYFVAGGFISPDHDTYVHKKCGLSALSAADRISRVKKAVAGSDWIDVDPWAALYNSYERNFTDSIIRLERYLGRYLSIFGVVRVAYVCGGDNALLAKAFSKRGICIVVPRDRADAQLAKLRSYQALMRSGRVLIGQSTQSGHLSSTEIRKQCVPAPLQYPERVEIFLRDEEGWESASWSQDYADTLSRARRCFAERLKGALHKAFEPHCGTSTKVTTISASAQAVELEKFMAKTSARILSLDALTEGDARLEVSRSFAVSSSRQLDRLEPREGAMSLQTQISLLPPGRYVVVDDDIATGRTLRSVIEALPPHCSVECCVSLLSLVTKSPLEPLEVSKGGCVSDVGDMRDFIVGSRSGGLHVRLPDGSHARAPYMAPYVELSSRMSMPVTAELSFSATLWLENARFFASLSKPLCVRDASPEFQVLAFFLGWGRDDTLEDFCWWHLRALTEAVRERMPT